MRQRPFFKMAATAPTGEIWQGTIAKFFFFLSCTCVPNLVLLPQNARFTHIWSLSGWAIVRGEVLPAHYSPPHMIVFSNLLCLLSSYSSLPPRLSSSHLSLHSPPISALASLVCSCPPRVTMPLSSVLCYPPSFLRVLSTVACSSPVSLSGSFALPPIPLTPPLLSYLP